MADDHGAPIAWLVLGKGTPVRTADGHDVGKVRRVLADEGKDIFDGITVDTSDGERFVDAAKVGDLYERLVLLTISGEEARALPEHSASPVVVDLSPDDLGGPGGGASGTPPAGSQSG